MFFHFHILAHELFIVLIFSLKWNSIFNSFSIFLPNKIFVFSRFHFPSVLFFPLIFLFISSFLFFKVPPKNSQFTTGKKWKMLSWIISCISWNHKRNSNHRQNTWNTSNEMCKNVPCSHEFLIHFDVENLESENEWRGKTTREYIVRFVNFTSLKSLSSFLCYNLTTMLKFVKFVKIKILMPLTIRAWKEHHNIHKKSTMAHGWWWNFTFAAYI